MRDHFIIVICQPPKLVDYGHYYSVCRKVDLLMQHKELT
jgi:hypothetical protein